MNADLSTSPATTASSTASPSDASAASVPVRPAIAAMRGYVPGEQPAGRKLVKLNTNENPYPPSDKVVAAITAAAQTSLVRYPDPDATAFRIAAAERWNLEPDWFLCGNGSDDCLTILTRAFVGEGQVLRTAYPTYILYKTLCEIQGAVHETVPFRSDWTLGEEFCRVATDGAGAPRLAIVANPNSPSGTTLPPEAIAELASRMPCPLVVDEAYADFADTHCVDLVRDHANVIVTRTLSKSYGLAGLRFGYLIAQPQVIDQLDKVKDSYNCDALAIAGAAAALADHAWLQTNRERVLATRERLTRGLVELGFDVTPSQANFVWTNHPDHTATALFQGLRDRGILVRHMVYPSWGDGLRITVGTDAQIDAVLLVLGELVDAGR